MHRPRGLLAGITPVPDTKADFHGGLGELIARLSCGESAHDISIDGPDNLGRRPVNCVGVKSGLGRCNADVFGDTIVQDAFAKVVGLGLSSIGTSELPVDLVQIIGEQNHAADYTFAWSYLGDILDTSEEEEEVGINGWRITLLPKVEHGTLDRVEGSVLVESAGPVAGKRFLLREIHKI